MLISNTNPIHLTNSQFPLGGRSHVPRGKVSFKKNLLSPYPKCSSPPPLLTHPFSNSGYGVAHFAETLLRDRQDSLEGKRCMIIGSGRVAQTLAAKLLEYGAIPISFSDSSGHIHEPEGFDRGKLRTVVKVKGERGAKVGRYIIASTTATYNDPDSIWDIPCDLCFPCSTMGVIGEEEARRLGDNGCEGVIEGGNSAVDAEGRKELKKLGMLHGPSTIR